MEHHAADLVLPLEGADLASGGLGVGSADILSMVVYLAVVPVPVDRRDEVEREAS